MENKRLTRKLNSIFWWVLMAMPLILLIITYIVAIPQYAKNYDWNNTWFNFIDDTFNQSEIFEFAFNQFDNMSVIHIFGNVFNQLGLSEPWFIGYLFNWFASIYLYHLIFDCVVFIFDWLHDFFERG